MTCGENTDENLSRALAGIADAADRGASIVCLQELFRTTYFCQAEDARRFDLAEPIPGPTTAALAAAARQHRVAIVGSLFERRTAGIYHNTAVTLNAAGELVGRYRKMHVPDDPLYYEKYYFTPGDLGFVSVPVGFGQIGVLVCWDQWYPEAARLTAMAGAEVLFYPTAIGWHLSEKSEFGVAQHSAWETMQRSHAIANGVFVAVPNRVGREGDLEFWGGSFVADPFGRVLHRASHDLEEVLVVRCNLAQIEDVRRNWPFFRDRRIDAYSRLTERFSESGSREPPGTGSRQSGS